MTDELEALVAVGDDAKDDPADRLLNTRHGRLRWSPSHLAEILTGRIEALTKDLVEIDEDIETLEAQIERRRQHMAELRSMRDEWVDAHDETMQAMLRLYPES